MVPDTTSVSKSNALAKLVPHDQRLRPWGAPWRSRSPRTCQKTHSEFRSHLHTVNHSNSNQLKAEQALWNICFLEEILVLNLTMYKDHTYTHWFQMYKDQFRTWRVTSWAWLQKHTSHTSNCESRQTTLATILDKICSDSLYFQLFFIGTSKKWLPNRTILPCTNIVD